MDLSGNGGSKIQPYNLPTQGADIDEQVKELTPEFQQALPFIGGMLNQMGVADGAEISSAARTREHNAEVNGSPTSQHIIDRTGAMPSTLYCLKEPALRTPKKYAKPLKTAAPLTRFSSTMPAVAITSI